MKTLIVTAHPSSKGFTHQIAEAYKNAQEKRGVEVEILDLYKTELKQDFMRFEEPSDMGNPDLVKDAMRKKITEANNIVFVHPMWWVSMPSILKNYIDINFGARYAYRYINGRPVGLLGGRTASVYITCDGSRWIYYVIGMPFWIIWKFGILGFCGMKVKRIKLFDRKLFRTDDEKKAFLDKVKGWAIKDVK